VITDDFCNVFNREKRKERNVKKEMDNSQEYSTDSDKDIIRKILSENESDAQALEKMYKLLHEASSADDLTMDTDLIDECIKTIGMLEDGQNHVPDGKLQKMRQEVKLKYTDLKKNRHKRIAGKTFVRVAACLIFAFSLTVVVANAFGYNPIKMIILWKDDTFNLYARNESSDGQLDNVGNSSSFDRMDDAFEGLIPTPMMPGWIPEGFSFKYAEKFVRSYNVNILLNYENDDGEVIIFDYVIYNSHVKNVEDETSFEKDSGEVEIYEKNGIKYYIFTNLEQVHAVWGKLNVIYNISGDISSDEMKKIIDYMYGG
jgi:hypothetical protein